MVASREVGEPQANLGAPAVRLRGRETVPRSSPMVHGRTQRSLASQSNGGTRNMVQQC